MTDADLSFAGAAELAAMIRRGVVSAADAMTAALDRVESLNGALNAVITVNDKALASAREADLALSRGELRGPLHGVPVTVKDAYDVAGLRRTAGSLIYKDHVASTDATVVARLRAAGAIVLGKTNLPEFCLGVETENRIFGRTVNPWALDRTPGGSSGGEAAAIAAGFSALGVGSDQGGSLRLPAHYCGIAGFKPTLGRVPVTGHFPDTLQQFATAGFMARYVEDIQLALDVSQGRDPSDWYSDAPVSERIGEVHTPSRLKRLRVGYVNGAMFGPLEGEIENAVSRAVDLLAPGVAKMSNVSDDPIWGIDCDLLSEGLYRAQGRLFLNKVIEGNEHLLYSWLGAELSRATKGLEEYLQAAAGVEKLRSMMTRLFDSLDLLVCPVAPIVAPVCGLDHIVVNGEVRRLRSVNRALQPFNLTCNPAASVPFCLSSAGMPIGIQIVGRKYHEAEVLMLAAQLERVRPLGRRLPVPAAIAASAGGQ